MSTDASSEIDAHSRWIELDGAVNVRDLGGLPTADGQFVRRGRLIRSDNLQDLSAADVALLKDELGVRAVADLRTGVEVNAEGPGPLHAHDDIDIRHLSLFPEAGTTTDVVAAEDAPVILPWQNRAPLDSGRQGASGVYLGYLDDRADSVVDALRLIAHSPGATIVHCAAGKDRTGVVVAVALAEVGVEREAIIDDYALTAERIDGILARLGSSATYAEDLTRVSADKHTPRAQTMRRLLDAVDDQFGGVPAWLRTHGWTDEDAAALRAKLLD